MNEPLDELYLRWLYSQIGSVKTRDASKTYWGLAKLLLTKEFVWIIPNDDNRVEDGKDLRLEFLRAEGITEIDPCWMELGCSMLEMMIGLSRRLSFEAGGEPREWFFELIDNLGLYDLTDSRAISKRKVEQVLDQLIWRNYDPDGTGGMFPLRYADRDQRDVEIWYQMQAYLIERE